VAFGWAESWLKGRSRKDGAFNREIAISCFSRKEERAGTPGRNSRPVERTLVFYDLPPELRCPTGAFPADLIDYVFHLGTHFAGRRAFR